MKNFVKGYPIYALGNPGNTGDGIRMAQKVGAGLWHMNGVSSPLGIKVHEIEAAFYMGGHHAAPHHVDKHGKRFVDEKAWNCMPAFWLSTILIRTNSTTRASPATPSSTRKRGAKGRSRRSAGRGYAGASITVEQDNSVEVEKGWITEGQHHRRTGGQDQDRWTRSCWKRHWPNGTRTARPEDTQFHQADHAPAGDHVQHTTYRGTGDRAVVGADRCARPSTRSSSIRPAQHPGRAAAQHKGPGARRL